MSDNKDLRYLALVSQLGLTMIGTIGIGFGIGYFLDLTFDTSPIFVIIFLVVGVLAGFYSIYQLIMKDIRRSERNSPSEK